MTLRMCGSCLEAASEEASPFGLDETDVAVVLAAIGGEIPDHICEVVEYPETPCGCGCRRYRGG